MDHQRNQSGNKKIPRDKWKQKHENLKPMGHSKSSSMRKVYSNKIQINNLNLTPKATRERRTKNPKWVEVNKSWISEQKEMN